MKTIRKDFAECVQRFFGGYLGFEKGASHHTIRSYRDTFALLLEYLKSEKSINPDSIELAEVDRCSILSFLDWLEKEKGASVSTRNQRCAAIKSFARQMMYLEPEYLAQWKGICSIRMKGTVQHIRNHMTVKAMTMLLESIPKDVRGQRDLAMLALLYYTGARVSELICLTPSSIRFSSQTMVELYGKGNKKRIVPIDTAIAALMKAYMSTYGLSNQGRDKHPLFFNARYTKLTTPGIAYVINKYVDPLRLINPDAFPEKVTPHCFRHTRAMHLLEAGVNLIVIRDLLGHVSVQTTEVYAKASAKLKRMALENAYIEIGISEPETKSWEKDSKLKAFLKGLV